MERFLDNHIFLWLFKTKEIFCVKKYFMGRERFHENFISLKISLPLVVGTEETSLSFLQNGYVGGYLKE